MTRPIELPAENWAEWLAVRVEDQLAAATAALDTIKDGAHRSAAQLLELWNDSDIGIGNAAAVTSLLSEVHPDPEVRRLAEERAQDIDRFSTDRDLDRALFDAVDATDVAGLDDSAVRLRERVLRDFRRSGVDRADDVRARLREIQERLTVLDQDFARVIREDVGSIRVLPEQLAGLPADYVAAHEPADDGLVTITTDYPDYVAFRTFATDAAARRSLTIRFLNRGYPTNDVTLQEMLALRDERARALGFQSWPDYDADVKMIGSSPAIAEFIERLADAAGPAALRDRDVLVERQRRDDPDAQSFDASVSAYYLEVVRREQFDVDAQHVRRYFDFGRVHAGLLEVTGRLFGVSYRAVDAHAWDDDVASYDVVAGEDVIGRIHLDLHPRDGKYKHAAQFDLVAGADGSAGQQLPEGVLVCNFSRGLMEHSQVVTLFHEFGHLVHHVLGGAQHYARFSGVATEWDFVEAPSQLLEEWAWDADILRSFALDADGTPIPRELVERMRAANEFGTALFVRTQLFYSALSYLVHRDRPADITALLRELQARYDMTDYLTDTHFYTSFGHLAGYTSAYYTYLWSLVIAKDLFAAFDPGDLFAAGVAHRYRDAILVPGGTRDAADLVSDFLGRPFGFEAFAAWLDGKR